MGVCVGVCGCLWVCVCVSYLSGCVCGGVCGVCVCGGGVSPISGVQGSYGVYVVCVCVCVCGVCVCVSCFRGPEVTRMFKGTDVVQPLYLLHVTNL